MAKYKKRADGRYYAAIRTGRYKPDGKPISVYLYARTVKELEQKIAEAKYKMGAGVYCFGKDTLFGDYADQWLETAKAGVGINTRRMYSDIIRLHTDLLRNRKLSDITKMDVQRQINACADHPRTCEQLKTTLNQIFESAMDDDIIGKNPSRNVELPRKVVKEKRAFTSAEREAIRSAEYTPQEKAYIMLLYCCGLRPAEALALTWSDINFRQSEVNICKDIAYDGERPVVVNAKNDYSVRTLPLHPMALDALREFKHMSNRTIQVFEFNGKPLTKSRAETLYKHAQSKITAALGRPFTLTAYYFRHNFCSECYYKFSLKETIRLMGHRDEKMVMKVYAHLDAAKENTADKLRAMNF